MRVSGAMTMRLGRSRSPMRSGVKRGWTDMTALLDKLPALSLQHPRIARKVDLEIIERQGLAVLMLTVEIFVDDPAVPPRSSNGPRQRHSTSGDAHEFERPF